MKNYILIFFGAAVFALLSSCSEDEPDLEASLALVANKLNGNIIFEDSTFDFSVSENGSDVTNSSKFYVNGVEISGSTFTADVAGIYKVSAKKEGQISNEISVQVSETAQFKHKVILEDFTQVICGYCPTAIDKVNQLTANNDQIIPITIHVHYYPIQFVVPESIDLFFNYLDLNATPTLYSNRVHKWPNPFEESNPNYPVNLIKPQSEIGISINSSFTESEQIIDVEFAFSEAVTTEFYYTILILENDLIYPQDNNNSDLFGGQNPIPDFLHQHVLRGFTTDNITGDILPLENMHNNIVNLHIENPYIYEYENLNNLEIVAYIMDENKKIITGQKAAVNTLQEFEFEY